MKQTAGHDTLGEFAPEFAHLNDDVLFGEVWSREDKLSLKLRSIATISALIGKTRRSFGNLQRYLRTRLPQQLACSPCSQWRWSGVDLR